MSLYISSRGHFLNRFEPHKDGYLYNVVAGSPGVYVTAEERLKIIADYDRTDLPVPVVVFLGILAGIICVVACALASVPEPWRTLSFFVGYLGPPALHSWCTDPMRKRPILGRPKVESSLSKSEARTRSLDDTSWSMIVLWLFITAAQVHWTMTQREMGAAELSACIALTLPTSVLSIWFGFRKVLHVWRRRSVERR